MDDPFALLGLPRRYGLDRAALEAAYLGRSAALHPDLGGAGLEDSAALNEARETLQDPERRAVALWRLLGGSGDEKALPGGYLMRVMEWREELEAARASGDAGSLAAFERLAEERRREHQRAVEGLFDAVEAAGADVAGLLGRIRLELNAWRYTERLLEQLG